LVFYSSAILLQFAFVSSNINFTLTLGSGTNDLQNILIKYLEEFRNIWNDN